MTNISNIEQHGKENQVSSGSEQVLAQLDNVLIEIANDLKKLAAGEDNFTIINNEPIMEMVMKIVDKSDKIKKLNGSAILDTPSESTAKPVNNIQDLILNGKKS